MQSRFLIHPGYPKCASTALQANVFAAHPDMQYLSYGSAPGTILRDDPANLEFHSLLQGHPRIDPDRVRAIWQQSFVPALDPQRLNVISEEKFLDPFRPLAEVAAELRAVVGPAKVLIVLRDQADILRSLYDMKPWVRSDPARRYVPFSVWLNAVVDDPEDRMNRALRFRTVHGIYADLFGAEAVTMVTLSRLLKDAATQAELCARLGIDAPAFAELLARPAVNSAEDHGYKKLSRRVLGRYAASDFLSRGQVIALKSVVNRIVPQRKTPISPEDAQRIRNAFAGQRIEDLAATGAPGLLL